MPSQRTCEYSFESRLPHSIHGTIAYRATLRTDTGWQNPYVLSKPVAFTGDRASVNAPLDLDALSKLLAQLARNAGSTAPN